MKNKEISEAYQSYDFVVKAPKPQKGEVRASVERGGDKRGGKGK